VGREYWVVLVFWLFCEITRLTAELGEIDLGSLVPEEPYPVHVQCNWTRKKGTMFARTREFRCRRALLLEKDVVEGTPKTGARTRQPVRCVPTFHHMMSHQWLKSSRDASRLFLALI
jgi:hypothetical protein